MQTSVREDFFEYAKGGSHRNALEIQFYGWSPGEVEFPDIAVLRNNPCQIQLKLPSSLLQGLLFLLPDLVYNQGLSSNIDTQALC